jgi:plastocyanin
MPVMCAAGAPARLAGNPTPTMKHSLDKTPSAAQRGAGRLASLTALAFLTVLPLMLPASWGLAAALSPLAAEELQGRIELLAKDGKGPARGSDPSQAVAYFEPTAAGHAPKAPETPFQLVTHFKEFLPHVLVVPVGSRVQFPNQDPILHNVFSVSSGNTFDLGIYRNGPPKEKRFDQPGLVRVFCNVHQAMVAYILVLDTPFYTSPGADGSFRLSGLPKGPGKLTVWHEQAETWFNDLSLPLAAGAPPVAPRLVVVRPKLAPHTNKTGGSYVRGDDYR